MMKKYCFTIIMSSFVCLLNSCQSYTSETKKMREETYAGNYQAALADLDKSHLATEKQSSALYQMEKGMLFYLQGQNQMATPLWINADQHLEDLYTVSISNTAESLLVNDSKSDYTATAHERVLLPIFTSMAFFESGNIGNALVMIRRTNDVLNELSEANQGQNTFKYDAFSHYFAGMVYEAKGEWDNAMVEYKQALQNLNALHKDNKQSQLFSGSREEILKSLARLGHFRQRQDIINLVKENLFRHSIQWPLQTELMSKGEVYLVYESGRSPIKIPQDSFLNIGHSLVRISYPEYIDIPYRIHHAMVSVNGQVIGPMIVMENIGEMARLALRDQASHDLAKMTTRLLLKVGASELISQKNELLGTALSLLNSATEEADTRSWTTLPDTLQVLRVQVPANQESIIQINPEMGLPKVFKVKLHAGEKQFFRFRTTE